jgi:hypothetical protein
MNHYSYYLYKEIQDCHKYETRNSSIYGNVVLREMEFAQSGKERGVDQQGDEDHI